MKFKPTGNRILIEPIQGQNETVRGMHIPSAYRDTTPSEGVVVALGTTGPFEVKVGDRVVINRFNGTEVKVGGKIFKIMDVSELLAIVE
jgi:chaperonin GroES